ncbi:hypothetical protein JB92DRAFT_2733590 [Gautieria morchelliformis]|nr:hypothetical protein JB92DRAFT_2733590 [Gautieria morchelliformis]
MHVPTLNLGPLLIQLWQGKFQRESTDDVKMWDWAVLKTKVWEAHGQSVADCRPYLPGSFDRPPRNIALKMNSNYKAKEWQGYLYGLAPALLYRILPRKYWQNFCKLVRAVRMIHQRTIPLAQLLVAQQCLDEFHLQYEILYVQRRVDQLHFVRPCIHALLHFGLEVPRLGPPTIYSTWTIERTIGIMGQELKQPSNPYHNLSQRAVQRAQLNALFAMVPSLSPDNQNSNVPSMELGDRYALLRARDWRPRQLEGVIGGLVSRYILNKEQKLGNNPAPNWHVTITRWARLWLPNGQIAHSLWKEECKTIDELQRARCVKLHLDGTDEFTEVQFYFPVRIAEKTQILAVVRLFSCLDPILYEESQCTVYSVMELDDTDGLQLVDAKSILSVVAVIPHAYHVRPDKTDKCFFIWEQMGLELAHPEVDIDQ